MAPPRSIHRALTHGSTSLSDEQAVEKALAIFLEFYRVHKLDNTFVYPGVLEALRSIRHKAPSLQMACLTNKPIHASRTICDALGLTPFFFQIYGGNRLPDQKASPRRSARSDSRSLGMRAGLRQARSPARAGRDRPDRRLLHRHPHSPAPPARCRSGCTYGFAPESLHQVPPDVTVDSAAEWPSLLLTPSNHPTT